ncbi:hypothetical protein AVEN_150563-1 [Araneus ventricosus]|uniref:Uncharacterized protein n=1 Tax=Araneus ventricosus TaxID=182803 RepID=A0A4Y2THE5_ARAVE|nr:hypothetical protein AVEN_150563-1 [Araneus ventricosus]
MTVLKLNFISDYSRHESHYPSYYPHYEGFRDEHDHSHYDHGHHHHGHHHHGHHHHGHHHYGHHHRGHHEHGHHHQDHHDHGHDLSKHKVDNPVSVSISITPRKPKGKFYVPSVCGDYDLEKNKVCIQIPDKHCRKSERSGDRMSCHNQAHAKLDEDYAKNRYSCPETRYSDRVGRKYHCGSSSRNGAMPHFVGLVGGTVRCDFYRST